MEKVSRSARSENNKKYTHRDLNTATGRERKKNTTFGRARVRKTSSLVDVLLLRGDAHSLLNGRKKLRLVYTTTGEKEEKLYAVADDFARIHEASPSCASSCFGFSESGNNKIPKNLFCGARNARIRRRKLKTSKKTRSESLK